MINTSHLCMECMKDKAEAEVCPHCGYREEALQTAPYLPLRSWLMDRYLVGKMLTCDGEGVTYIGWDNILQAPVTVREYLPDGLCERASDGLTVRGLAEDYSRCLAGFLSRARALARMRDLAALFPTYDIFELNGTAYAVSEYTESISLGEFLHRNGEALTFEQTRVLMLLSSALIGFGQGYQPVCSYNYGAKRYDRVREGYLFCVKYGTLLMAAAAAVCLIWARPIIGWFRDDPAVIAVGATALRWQAAALPLLATSVLTNMMLQATGKGLKASVTSSARNGIFFIPLIFILPRCFGLLGVEMTQAWADVLTFLLCLYVMRGEWGQLTGEA